MYCSCRTAIFFLWTCRVIFSVKILIISKKHLKKIYENLFNLIFWKMLFFRIIRDSCYCSKNSEFSNKDSYNDNKSIHDGMHNILPSFLKSKFFLHQHPASGFDKDMFYRRALLVAPTDTVLPATKGPTTISNRQSLYQNHYIAYIRQARKRSIEK